MKKRIDEIVVGDRVRQDVGELTLLKQSIKRVGLINPIVINENNELLAGYRRLQACKEIGMEEIEVKVVRMEDDRLRELDWEYHENIGRKDLTAEDKRVYFEERDRLLNPPKINRFTAWLKKVWQKIAGLFAKLKRPR